MLSKLLSCEGCAKCKICCSFDSYDLWETPIIADEKLEIIKREVSFPVDFVTLGGVRLLRLNREPDEDLYYCSLLDKEKGCLLGKNKPFECSIWPLRVMRMENSRRVITISPVCPTVMKVPLSTLLEIAEELSPTIFRYSDISPEIIKPYLVGYPILIVE